MSRKEGAAAVYLTLAEFWKPPTEEFFRTVADGTTDKALSEAVALASYDHLLPNDCSFQKMLPNFDRLQSGYLHFFLGVGATPALPVESVYKKWTEDESARLPMASSKGYLMGDAGLHMQYLFGQYGLEVPVEYRMMPDHLTLLLEFAAFLIREGKTADVKTFLTDHFDWLDDFAAAMQERFQQGEVNNTDLLRFFQQSIQCIQSVVAAEVSQRAGEKEEM